MPLSDAPAAAWAKFESMLERHESPELSRRQIAATFVLFVVVWTLYGTIAGAGHALHGDLAEAHAWGREFQLGYSQHPPFWAWIAGAWFAIFPHQDWLSACWLSPAIAYVNFAFSSLDTATKPYRELAQAATDIWHQEVGTPLRLVGGSSPFEEMVEFYSPDHPRALIATNFAKAPWITPQQIAAEGIIGVCTLNDWYCRQVLDPLVFKNGGHILMITLQHEFWGVKKPTVSFDIYVIPPQRR